MGDEQRSESDYVARCKLTIKLKDDEESLRKIRQQGHFSLFHKGKPFISVESHENLIGTSKLIWLGFNDLKSLAINESEENSVLLDIVNGGIARFAVSLPSVTDKVLDEISAKHNGNFADLRAAFLYMLNAESATVARHGSALLHWMHNTRFCQRCGDQLTRNAAGNHKHCAKCGTTHYPYTSPAIITLVVEDETDRCLLVRQPQFIPGWYTAIAGFVETGESLEDAVRREVAEEVGFEVDRLEYFNSQPWPIPKSTLMLACIAHVKPGQKIDIDRKELEDAQWVSKEELASIYQKVTEDSTVLYSNSSEDDGKVRMIPMKGTSANDLVKHWLSQQSSKL